MNYSIIKLTMNLWKKWKLKREIRKLNKNEDDIYNFGCLTCMKIYCSCCQNDGIVCYNCGFGICCKCNTEYEPESEKEYNCPKCNKIMNNFMHPEVDWTSDWTSD